VSSNQKQQYRPHPVCGQRNDGHCGTSRRSRWLAPILPFCGRYLLRTLAARCSSPPTASRTDDDRGCRIVRVAPKRCCGCTASPAMMIAALVRAGLATATAERMRAGGKTIEVTCVRITEAGRTGGVELSMACEGKTYMGPPGHDSSCVYGRRRRLLCGRMVFVGTWSAMTILRTPERVRCGPSGYGVISPLTGLRTLGSPHLFPEGPGRRRLALLE